MRHVGVVRIVGLRLSPARRRATAGAVTALCRAPALYVALEAGTGVSELARVPKQEAATNTTPCRLHGLSRGSPEGEVTRAPLPVDRDTWLVNVAIIHRGLTERLAGLTRGAVGGASEQAALVDAARLDELLDAAVGLGPVVVGRGRSTGRRRSAAPLYTDSSGLWRPVSRRRPRFRRESRDRRSWSR